MTFSFLVCGLDFDERPIKPDSGIGLVVAGENANLQVHPWVVSLVIVESSNSRKLHCTGTLISDRHVLTASHCLLDVNLTRIVILLASVKPEADYEEDRVVRTLENHWKHPDYQDHQAYYDIAVVLLNQPINFTKYIYPVCLPEQSQPIGHRENRLATIVGYGPDLQQPRRVVLSQAFVQVNTMDVCKNDYTDNGQSPKLKQFLDATLNRGFDDGLICASNPVGSFYNL